MLGKVADIPGVRGPVLHYNNYVGNSPGCATMQNGHVCVAKCNLSYSIIEYDRSHDVCLL